MDSTTLKHTDYLKAWLSHMAVMTVFGFFVGSMIGVVLGLVLALQGRPATEVQLVVQKNIIMLQSVVGLIGLPVSFFTFKMFVDKFLLSKIKTTTNQAEQS